MIIKYRNKYLKVCGTFDQLKRYVYNSMITTLTPVAANVQRARVLIANIMTITRKCM